ncbi:MAG: hypothetical protein ACXABK_05035 [Candidatus Heimdallarchaeaceae archaeon]
MIELKVSDCKQRDVARGIARIDHKAMEELGVKAGDPIKITGNRSTAAIAWPAYAEDQNKGLIRMDGFIRKNAGTSINDLVNIDLADVRDASQITLEPEEMHLNIDQDFILFVKNRLLERVFLEGDSTLVMMLGHPITFILTETVPDGIVRLTYSTKLLIKGGPVKEKGEAEPIRRKILASQITKQVHKAFRMGKRDNTVMTRLSNDDLKQIDMMVGIGLFESRSEAVAYLTHEGVEAKREMFNQLSRKFEQIENIRNEAKALLGTSVPITHLRECPKCGGRNNLEFKFCSSCGKELATK